MSDRRDQDCGLPWSNTLQDRTLCRIVKGKGVKSSSSSRAQVKLQDCQAREFYLRSGVYSGYECMDGSSMSSTGMPFALTRTKASFFIVLSKKIYRRSQSEMEHANKEVSLQATLTVRTRILVVMITLTWLQWSCDCVVIANAAD